MRHHYVPQFLLRSWTDCTSDGKIEVFRVDLNPLSSTRHTPKYTGFEEDLYALSMPVVAGMEQQAIEKKFLKIVDNYAALVRNKLENEGLRTLTLEERRHWAIFLMSLRLRQPEIIQFLRSEAANHLKTTLATQPEQYEELAGEDDPLTLEKWTENIFQD